MRELTTDRLILTPLRERDLEAFHALVLDPHVLRFLLDGEEMDRAWCAEEIRIAAALEQEFGAGLWLVRPRSSDSSRSLGSSRGRAPIGFAGYKRFEDLHEEPELLYALVEAHTGRGLATEIATELVRYAREESTLPRIVSAVDAPNGASIRVLEKVGFVRHGVAPGAFGDIVLFELPDVTRD